MLDRSIYHFRGVEFLCSFSSIFDGKTLLENIVDPNQTPNITPHYVASDLGLHCLPMTLLHVSR